MSVQGQRNFPMATPNNPRYPYQPLKEQADYPPPVDYGYPPQNQGASAQYPPPPTVQGYPPQPQTDPTTQGPPPAYVYQPDQPAYNYQPQLANATVVVAAQPVTATTTSVSPPEENHSGIAICALVFSLCTLFTCGASVICLSLSIPALILAIVALGTRGNSQKSNAGISIGLNVAVVVCSVFVIVAVATPAAVIATSAARTRFCSSYYSDTYRTYCAPRSYDTTGSCAYYDLLYDGHCSPTTSDRCPDFYSSTYGSYCSGSGYSSCSYSPHVGGYCPSYQSRSCSSFYDYTYSTRCLPSSYSTRSSTPCRFYASYSTGHGYCPT